MRNCPREYLKKDAKSSAVCIRDHLKAHKVAGVTAACAAPRSIGSICPLNPCIFFVNCNLLSSYNMLIASMEVSLPGGKDE
jgi:hypothetical protein